jgi:hypothetical protein
MGATSALLTRIVGASGKSEHSPIYRGVPL